MKMKHPLSALLSIFLLLDFPEGVFLMANGRILAAVGTEVSLLCGEKSQGSIVWNRNGGLLLRYNGYRKFQNNAIRDISRFSVISHSNNNLCISDVKLTDAGNYTCLKEKTPIFTTELFVFGVSATPSISLIMSEDLTLMVRLSPEQTPGLQVSWRKDEKEIGTGTSLEMKNLTLEDSGEYQCIVKMDGSDEGKFQKYIIVRGFIPSPAIVYPPKSWHVTIPWQFNFAVRQNLIFEDLKVVGGNVTHSFKTIKQLNISNGASCWPGSCDLKLPHDRLDVNLSNPESGDYRLEVIVEVGSRRTRLWKDVCVAALTVSASEDEPTMESTLKIMCTINCLDNHKKLCWHHIDIDQEICGSPGQKSLSQGVTITPEVEGAWTCKVAMEQINATVMLKVKLGILDISHTHFWVMVGVGAILLLLIVVAICIVIARCRRMRRSRHRAWMLQTIHQQKMCKCKGFAPTRLKENI